MKNVICFLLLCLSLATVSGQGWEHLYSFSPYQTTGIGELMPTPDGGFLLNSRGYSTPPPFDTTLEYAGFYKIAADGTEQWRKTHAEVFGALAVAMRPAGSNRLLFVTLYNDTVRLVKTDGNLQPVWSYVLDSALAMTAHKVQVKAVTGGYAIVYQKTGQQSAPMRIIKTDVNGTVLWQNDYTFIDYFTFREFTTDESGNLFVFGEGGLPFGAVMAKVSPSGSVLLTQQYANASVANSPILVNDNLLAFLSGFDLHLIDGDGQPVRTFEVGDVYRIAPTIDGKILLGFYSFSSTKLQKINPDSTLIWSQTFNNLNAGFDKAPTSIWSLPDGGVIAGFVSGNGSLPYYLVRTDINGQVYTNQVHGHIFADVDDNCLELPGTDFAAPGVSIIAQEGQNFYYATTDSLGNYALPLDTGTYLLRVLPPGDNNWQVCDDSLLVTLSPYDTLAWSTGINSIAECPRPSVSLTAPFLRRCFPSNYQVAYGNGSDVTADSAVVTLTLDPFLQLQSASLPYTSVGGNVYQFALGDLAPLQTGVFSVEVYVDCSAELGQTHCSLAQIKVLNPCSTTANATPIIKVNASCEGDSVAFRIRNSGGAPMVNPSEFVIIEDLIVMRQGQFQLPAQDEIIIKCPASGSTARIYAGQQVGEPPFFAPTTAIEGCNGPIQPGYWNMYPEIFARQDIFRDCQPNIGSFDPNDKQAVPTGYDNEHYIGQNVGLDYKIRFQNTGTDTAFTVVVRDTLSSWLDASTLRPGAGSHPYSWQLMGNGVVQFTFDHIQLPDSLTNLAASQGFISFHIDQKPEVPLQTLIENQAAIYFDFNEPVFTNTTFHRVGDKFIVVSAWEPGQSNVLMQAIPNPFTAETRLEVQGLTSQASLRLQIFDLQGKAVREMQSADGVFQVKKGNLDSGMYLFNITQNGRLVGRGKLMVQ